MHHDNRNMGHGYAAMHCILCTACLNLLVSSGWPMMHEDPPSYRSNRMTMLLSVPSCYVSNLNCIYIHRFTKSWSSLLVCPTWSTKTHRRIEVNSLMTRNDHAILNPEFQRFTTTLLAYEGPLSYRSDRMTVLLLLSTPSSNVSSQPCICIPHSPSIATL
ncbi:hypothetical protein EV361DRAFT_916953 [Lentinula raphanica]|nr:hypothetical protein EV361DRAFT_916953 [Lentinula raphanica]